MGPVYDDNSGRNGLVVMTDHTLTDPAWRQHDGPQGVTSRASLTRSLTGSCDTPGAVAIALGF